MREVILDKEWAKENENLELYYMYRDLWMEGDRKRILENDLRYDITVIPPRMLGQEFVKTKGHYHPECSPGLSYPEIYEILEGKAHFLLQKRTEKGIVDVILVEAVAGEKTIICPNYGHITINPGNETLKMANWVNRSFTSLYEEIEKFGGGAYFELAGGEFVRNPNYGEVPELRRVKPTVIPELGIEKGRDLYGLVKEPQNLRFLISPQDYAWVFERASGKRLTS
jgi:glucose-6-phosphate isomerase